MAAAADTPPEPLPRSTQIGTYKLDEDDHKLGKGRYCRVYKAQNMQNKRGVAMKIVYQQSESVDKETNVLQKLVNSAYFCEFVEVIDMKNVAIEGNGKILVMELCKKRNLSQHRAESEDGKFGFEQGALIGVEIIRILEALHRAGFVHCDVKPGQYVYPEKQLWNNHMKLVDFDQSEEISPKAVPGQKGTALYSSINVHDKGGYHQSDDLWAAVFVMLHISEGSLPWSKICKVDKGKEKWAKTKDKKQELVNWLLSDTDGGIGSFPWPDQYREMAKIIDAWDSNNPRYDDLVAALHAIVEDEKWGKSQCAEQCNELSYYVVLLLYANAHQVQGYY